MAYLSCTTGLPFAGSLKMYDAKLENAEPPHRTIVAAPHVSTRAALLGVSSLDWPPPCGAALSARNAGYSPAASPARWTAAEASQPQTGRIVVPQLKSAQGDANRAGHAFGWVVDDDLAAAQATLDEARAEPFPDGRGHGRSTPLGPFQPEIRRCRLHLSRTISRPHGRRRSRAPRTWQH